MMHPELCMERPLEQGQKARRSFKEIALLKIAFFRLKKSKFQKTFLTKVVAYEVV